MRRAKEIRGLEIDEISLVDKGANQHAKTIIAKRHEEKDTMEQYFDEAGNLVDTTSLAVGDVVYDENGEQYVYSDDVDDVDDDELDDDEGDEGDDDGVSKAFSFGGAGAGIDRGLGGLKRGASVRRARSRMKRDRQPTAGLLQAGGRARQGTYSAKESASAFTTPNRFAASSVNNAVWGSGRTARNRKIGAGVAGGAAAGGAGVEVGRRRRVSKSLADEVRVELSKALTDGERDEVISKALGQIEEYAEIAKAAEMVAEEERTLRLEREYTEIAKGYNVPVHPEELGRVLMHLAEVLPIEDQQVIAKCLDAASSELFEEMGHRGGGDNTDILGQVDQLVASQVSKSGISREEAVTGVFETNPDAYDTYLAERQGR